MALALIIPAEGARVRDPANGLPIPEKGKKVDLSSHRTFWARAERRGDVEIREVRESVVEPAKSED